MTQRLIGMAYGYIVCLASLALFGYGVATLVPSDGPFAQNQSPIEVSIFPTDTIATDTMGTDSPELYSFDRAAELQTLRASQKAFEDSRATLDRERERIADFRIGLYLAQRTLMLLFASGVFVFHWRWMRRLSSAV